MPVLGHEFAPASFGSAASTSPAATARSAVSITWCHSPTLTSTPGVLIRRWTLLWSAQIVTGCRTVRRHLLRSTNCGGVWGQPERSVRRASCTHPSTSAAAGPRAYGRNAPSSCGAQGAGPGCRNGRAVRAFQVDADSGETLGAKRHSERSRSTNPPRAPRPRRLASGRSGVRVPSSALKRFLRKAG
jgi:hypothetical protein